MSVYPLHGGELTDRYRLAVAAYIAWRDTPRYRWRRRRRLETNARRRCEETDTVRNRKLTAYLNRDGSAELRRAPGLWDVLEQTSRALEQERNRG